MAPIRILEPRDRVVLTLVVTDETTGNVIADTFAGGEDATLTAKTAAALLRGIADDLDPPARARR
jgi:hypothetical protein